MPVPITPLELTKLMQEQPVYLLDVRLPMEHDFVALPNTRLIPLQELPSRYGEVQVPPDAKLVVYCHHGVRSWHAAAFLEARGFPEVYSLEGGIDAWASEVDPEMKQYV